MDEKSEKRRISDKNVPLFIASRITESYIDSVLRLINSKEPDGKKDFKIQNFERRIKF